MLHFNAINYTKRLQEAGMPQKQADILAEEFSCVIDNNLVTKDDLKNVEQRLDNKIDNVETVLSSKISSIDLKLSEKINSIDTKLSAKIGSVDTKLNWLMSLIAFIGFLIAAANFIHGGI